jgi:hypothetical protein
MTTRQEVLWAGLAIGMACWVAPVLGAGTFPVGRQATTLTALTNTPILVSVTFTNSSTNTLRGFIYGEQVPSALTVSPTSATISGRTVTNYVLEAGQDGDVYPGCTPWRWRFETPTNFAETNLLLPQARVQIGYSLSAVAPGKYALAQFDWAGFDPLGTNAFFGFSQTNDQQVISIYASTNRPQLTAQQAANGVLVSLSGWPGSSYVIEASSDFLAWLPLVTNAASFTYPDMNNPGQLPLRFYRGRIYLDGP